MRRRMNKKSTSDNLASRSGQGTAYVIRAYSWLAIFSLGLFGVLHIIAHPQDAVGYLELAGATALLLNLAGLRFTRRVAVARNIFLLTVLAFLGLMLISGGTADTGLLWVFVFPVTAFFLAGKRAGMAWLVALLLLILGIWVLAATDLITIPYSGVVLRQLAISVSVVTVGIYVYQHTREQLASESQESRAQLRAEKVRSDVIVQHITEGIVTVDAEGKITFANPAAYKMLGWPAHELIGKNFIKAIPMLDENGREIASEYRPMHHALHEGESLTMNTTYRQKDGKPVPVSITGTPLVINGKIVGAIGTFRDISEEQDVVRAKSEFVTLASHQLRTPLSAVSWMSELLLNGDAGPLSAEQREHVKGIYRSNQRMAALVSEMLIVSGLDLHSLSVMPQKTELPLLAANVVKEVVGAHADHPKIKETYDPAVPAIQCDQEIMKIILRNLLSNAVKYTPKAGEVTVSIALSKTKKLNPHSKGSVVIAVSDTGYGIPKAATSKIFSKFFRAKNISHRDTDGTGLGLYIVKALLDYVDGQVTFHSEENKGTTFTVALPVEGMVAYQPAELTSLIPKGAEEDV